MTGEAFSGEVWQIVVDLPSVEAVQFFEAALADRVTGMSSFEIPDTPRWRITGYADAEPDRTDIAEKIAVAAMAAGVETPDIDIAPVESRDWVAEVERSLTPIHVGPYYVYGSHIDESPPNDAVAIRIDAGLAFGTGNHETTQGCLQAIETVCAAAAPANPLDIGTGSGILAIALAKRFGVDVTAGDNDPVAVDVARENADINGVGGQIVFHVADGLGHSGFESKNPFDLIVANIVANPLVAMAPQIAAAAAPGGAVILSGILLSQAKDVVAAYVAQGFACEDRIEIGDWATLVLRRDESA